MRIVRIFKNMLRIYNDRSIKDVWLTDGRVREPEQFTYEELLAIKQFLKQLFMIIIISSTFTYTILGVISQIWNPAMWHIDWKIWYVTMTTMVALFGVVLIGLYEITNKLR